MKKIIAACAVLVVLVLLTPRALDAYRLKRDREIIYQCQLHLWQGIDLALQSYGYPAYSNYPSSLSCLSSNDTCSELLLCPGVKEPQRGCARALADMDAYTDYIYVAGLTPASPPGIPIVICPPVNHDGKGGNILDTDHSQRWVPVPEIDKLIDWTYACAESNGLRVVVSEALTKRSKGRYTSRP